MCSRAMDSRCEWMVRDDDSTKTDVLAHALVRTSVRLAMLIERPRAMIDTVKVQIKKAGVRLATLIDAAAAGTMPEHLLKVTP
jgi:hypothetical protein